jgi:hypothetical protein
MRLQLHLTDDEWDRLGGNQQEIQDQIKKILQLVPGPLKKGDRPLVIPQETRVTLEKVLMRPLGTPEDLVFVVSALASLKIGTIERPLSVGEAARIHAYAQSMSLPIAQATRELIDPIVDELLMRV